MPFDYRTWGESWDESWGDSWGIGEEVGIGLAPIARPIDIVIQPAMGPLYGAQRASWAPRVEMPQREPQADVSELREMMALYTHWRRAQA
jgi:hypothetical protein